MNRIFQCIQVLFLVFCLGCKQDISKKSTATTNKDDRVNHLLKSKNILNYVGTPKSIKDKNMLMFSDQGAWFAYSLPDSTKTYGGFSGPFLMTQENGVWLGDVFSKWLLTTGAHSELVMNWKKDLVYQNSYSSHLEQVFENEKLKVKQDLVFQSGHTALQRTMITNISGKKISLNLGIQGGVLDIGVKISKESSGVKLISTKSQAIGYVQVLNEKPKIDIVDKDSFYAMHLGVFTLKPNESKEFVITQTFIFPEYSWEKEQQTMKNNDFDVVLSDRKKEKENQLASLIEKRNTGFKDDKYAEVLAKAHLTLQNNWRIPAGEIKYEGLFPSYHYKWFNGFWSWDSWKHAVGLSLYDMDLAKNQIRLMFEFQNEDGFVADCVYRDTTIEAHNYRDTKPPLSTWAVTKIFEKEADLSFVKEMYPKLKKYHYWWYAKRDHDKDGLCEYGSTDGSLVAAKWESGMDNAIRFDESKILENSEGAYSLDQESVDLNAYLYAEKLYLIALAKELEKKEDLEAYLVEAEILKTKIQQQFYDPEDGWFYDTNLKGDTFIKGQGSEGWTALWSKAATKMQAETVKNKMMDPNKFYTKVPFQTMSADHPKFDPLKGYWRGPNWLDQAYFGVKSLRNYGFNAEADKATIQILAGAEGILGKGKAIRENYHPITGEGLHAQNFSWSAAHIIMLLTED